MTGVMSRAALATAVICATAVVPMAQTPATSTSTEVKTFEVLAVDGNKLVVNLPEGTRELTVPDDFRFVVNGQQLSVRDLQAGMKGTATITTRTTSVPVTVTEVKNGTVVRRSNSGLIVRTGDEIKSFSQGEVDKRGVKIMRAGKPAQLADFREGDVLTATIITAGPPRIMTEKEVQATVPPVTATTGNERPAATTAAAPAPPPPVAAPTASAAPTQSAQAPTSAAATTLPKTATSWPLLALASVLSLVSGLALTVRRRQAR